MCLQGAFESLKISKNLEKWDLLFYEFQAEERSCQSFSGFFERVLVNGFWRKGYQMKAKDLVLRLKVNFVQKFHRRHCKNGGKKSFTTHLWSKVDVQYCERLYTIFESFDIFDGSIMVLKRISNDIMKWQIHRNFADFGFINIFTCIRSLF